MGNPSKELGQRIAVLRKNQKLTQAELAEKLNLSTEYISLLERGLRIPSVPVLKKIEKILDYSLKSLLGLKPEVIKDDKKKEKILKLVYLLKNKTIKDIEKIYNIAEAIFKDKSK